MNKEELTSEAIGKLLDYATATETFVAEQAPLVVQDIVTWGIVKGVGLMLVAMIAIPLGIASYLLIRMSIADGKKDIMDQSVDRQMAGSVFGILSGIGAAVLFIPCTIIGAGTTAQAYFAPRLYVIEELTRMAGLN